MDTSDDSQAPPDVQALFARLGRREYRIGVLENQNRNLKAQLEALRKDGTGRVHNPQAVAVTAAPPSPTSAQRSSPSHRSASQDAPQAPNALEDLTRRHNDLYQRYRALEAEHTMCNTVVEAALSKFRKARETIRQWKQYIDSKEQGRAHERRQGSSSTTPQQLKPNNVPVFTDALNETYLHNGDGDESPRRARPLAQRSPVFGSKEPETANRQSMINPDAYPASRRLPEDAFREGELQKAPDEQPLPIDTEQYPIAPAPSQSTAKLPKTTAKSHSVQPEPSDTVQRQSQRVTSSQSTEVDEAQSGDSTTLVKRGPSSDDEPRLIPERPVKRGRSTAAEVMPPPKRIKSENTSQENPIELHSGQSSSPVAQRTYMSRKETSDLDALFQATEPPRMRRDMTARETRASSQGQVDKPARRGLRRTPSLSQGDEPLTTVQEGAENVLNMNALDFALEDGANTRRALQPRSANVPTPPRKRPPKALAKATNRAASPLERAAFLSDDAEQTSSQAATVGHPGKGQARTPAQFNGRLDSLLDAPSTDHRAVARRVSPRSATAHPVKRRSPRPQQPQTEPRQSRKAHSPATNPQTARPKLLNTKAPQDETPTRPPQVPKGILKPPRDAEPEEEPMRVRGPDKLRLEDFKINPEYMGSSFAFADTLRGRDARRGMQAVENSDFRKMAEFGGNNTEALTGKSDAQVLQDYLGPDWETTIGSYARPKRNEMLISARAYALANLHGKQKQAFARRSTPPGFWRTDFPTTQDRVEDRRKALEAEKEKIHERWLEALRGGMWMFRDESGG
ncbi:hypothetical protein MBLNU230_g7653t1 [Neophaeotheca triangularis]